MKWFELMAEYSIACSIMSHQKWFPGFAYDLCRINTHLTLTVVSRNEKPIGKKHTFGSASPGISRDLTFQSWHTCIGRKRRIDQHIITTNSEASLSRSSWNLSRQSLCRVSNEHDYGCAKTSTRIHALQGWTCRSLASEGFDLKATLNTCTRSKMMKR